MARGSLRLSGRRRVLREVVRHERTDDRSVAVARAVLARAGKRAAVVRKDVPGMVGNRLQAALLREACALVEDPN